MLLSLMLWIVCAVAADPPATVHHAKPEGALPSFDDLQPVVSCCIAKDFVKAPITGQLPAIRACWTAHPSAERVKARVQFTLAKGDDTATDIVVHGTDDGLGTCITDVFGAMTWARAVPCTSRGTYPFVFAPAESPTK